MAAAVLAAGHAVGVTTTAFARHLAEVTAALAELVSGEFFKRLLWKPVKLTG